MILFRIFRLFGSEESIWSEITNRFLDSPQKTHWWPLAFLILSPPLQSFHVVLPTKKYLLCFLSLALDLCRPFSRWASLACHVLSLFLCPSFALYSKFVDMTINLSLYFRQHGYRNNFRFPFSCLLTLQLPLLYKTPVAMRFPSKITSSCIWVAIPVHWVILHWYACGADGRSGGRTVTWLPNFLG